MLTKNARRKHIIIPSYLDNEIWGPDFDSKDF